MCALDVEKGVLMVRRSSCEQNYLNRSITGRKTIESVDTCAVEASS